MTYGVKALRQIQLHREDTQGIASTDFTPWRGTGVLEDVRETVFPEEDIGIFGGVDRVYTPKTGGKLTLDEVEATFEQLPHIFDAAIYAATPTTDASSGVIRTWTFPLVSTDAKSSTDLQTYSFKFGDNAEVEQAHFGYVSDFTITGSAGEGLMAGATFMTRDVSTDGNGFETVTVPTVEEILFSKGKLYINAANESFGLTQKTGTLLSMSLNVTTGWQGIYTADGRSDFSFIKQVQPEIVLELTFEHDGTAQAEKAAWRAGTARLLQLKFEGARLTTTDAGATYDVKTFIINLAGKWEKFDALDEIDGDDVVTGTFRARYNATAAKFAEFIVVNEVDTMPG